MGRERGFRRVLGLIVASLVICAMTADGATYTVNEEEDLATGASCASGSTTCTLREAVIQADLGASPDLIILPAGHYRLSIAGRDEDDSVTGDLDITTQIDVVGAGADLVTIDGNGIDRVFDIRSDAVVGLQQVTITGGSVAVGEDGGGGIRAASSTLTLLDTRVVDNRAPDGGGIRASLSTVSITDSYIGNNTLFLDGVAASGGGVLASAPLELTVERSTISSNRCEAAESCNADGIYAWLCQQVDAVKIINSTLSGNEGRGVRSSDCDLLVEHSTVVSNERGLSFDSGSSHTLVLRSSIVADNSGVDCFSLSGVKDTAGGKNLDSDGSCGLDGMQGDLPSTPPALHSLGFYAAFAPSHHPMPGSPVIDVNDSCKKNRDQDNYYRPDGDDNLTTECDLGSIEVLRCDNPKPERLLGPDPIGSGNWAACHTLRANGTTILDGASVDFAARELIQFDDGFAVGAGASLTTKIRRTADWAP